MLCYVNQQKNIHKNDNFSQVTRLGSAGKIIIKQEKVFFFLGRGLLVRVCGFVIQLIKQWWPDEGRSSFFCACVTWHSGDVLKPLSFAWKMAGKLNAFDEEMCLLLTQYSHMRLERKTWIACISQMHLAYKYHAHFAFWTQMHYFLFDPNAF